MKKRGLVYVAAIIVLMLLIASLPAVDATEGATPVPSIKMTASPAPVVTGSISGAVFDMGRQGIPDAKVTLYVTAKLNNRYVNKLPASVDNNPQYTTADGAFVFENVPKGTYNVTVEKNGKIADMIVNVTEGTISPEIFMRDYIHVIPSVSYQPSPTPVITPTPSPVLTPSPKPSVKPTPTPYTPDISKIIFETAKLALMAVIGAQFIAGLAIFLYMKKLKRV